MTTVTKPPTTRPAPAGERAGVGSAEWLPVRMLHIGEGNPYQRDIRPQWLQWLADNMNYRLLGVLEVAKREDGSYWVEEGQHRVAALRQRGENDHLVLCHVKTHETIEEEADTAWRMNKHRRGWSAFADYNARVKGKEPVAVGMTEVCDKLGIKVAQGGPASKTGSLYAVGAALGLYQRDGGHELLERCLAVLKAAWHEENNAYSATILDGLSLLIAYHDEYIDEDRMLIPGLSRTTPDEILGEARNMKRQYKWGLSAYVAMAMEGAYNFKNQRHRIRETRAADYANALREYERGRRLAAAAAAKVTAQ